MEANVESEFDLEKSAVLNYRRFRHQKTVSISISSGKGGVGKTLTTINIAYYLQMQGYKVLILDGDFGLANVDVMLGLQPKKTIHDLLEKRATLSDIALDGPLGIKILPSGSGIAKMSNLQSYERVEIFDVIKDYSRDFDFLIVDTGAGIHDSVIHLNLCTDHNIIVTTPEPPAMTDAYALIKVLSENSKTNSLNLLINMVQSEQEAVKIFQRISDVSKRFLGVDSYYLGAIPLDQQLQRFVMKKQIVSPKNTHTISWQAISQVVGNLLNQLNVSKHQSQGFWDHLATPYQMPVTMQQNTIFKLA